MTREAKSINVTISSVPFPQAAKKVEKWLEEQIETLKNCWLLAHADDGVIWGKVMDGKLVTAPASPALRGETLQNARLFNQTSEIYLWRDGDGVFQTRSIQDAETPQKELSYFDEDQILWGNSVEATENGFTLLSDGAQGLKHYVPLEVTADGENRPLRLKVRHYLEEDDTGFVRIGFSRLVSLSVDKGKNQQKEEDNHA